MLKAWSKGERQTYGAPQSQAHVPRKYIANLVCGSHRQDFHLPARRDGLNDNLCPPFSTQSESSQVLDGDERATATGAVDDEPFAARAELPLATRSCSTRSRGLYEMPRRPQANRHDHARQEKGQPFSSFLIKSEKSDNGSHLLVVLPMKLICIERPVIAS
jgi:hypothetical protein